MKAGVCDAEQGLQGVVKKPGVQIVKDGQLRGYQKTIVKDERDL